MSLESAPPFVHLRVKSAYSLADGAIPVKGLVKLAAGLDMPAVALTDQGNLFGALEFAVTAADTGLQPVVGAVLGLNRASDEPGAGTADPDRLLLLAQDQTGYENLMALVSKGFLEGEGIEPAVDFADLGARADGLIALDGVKGSPLGRHLMDGSSRAAAHLKAMQSLFDGRLYLEIQRHGQPHERALEARLLPLAAEHGLPIVATNDAHFAGKDQFDAHEVLSCIAQGVTLAHRDRRRLTPEHYFKTSQDMARLFADLPEAVENTWKIARRCAVMPRLHPPILPAFDDGSGQAETEVLARMAREGLEARLQALEPAADAALEQTYRDRLDFELGVIKQMGFPGYFLIVADFIQWAKGQGIPVGPGRGSGAGSLVAYSLTITDIDPLPFNLLFERFLNPERVSMPDFDIDFCQDRRDEVIAYVRDKYGSDRVAQIITFGKLQARAVVRDVGRVLGMPYGQTDRIAKLIPNNPAAPTTLAEAIAGDEQLQKMGRTEEIVAKLFDIGQRLEGLFRNASTHAAGVVIGDRDLTKLVPLYKDPRSDMPATQFNMKWVEPAGLVKFDFLGLKTLTVIAEAERLIRRFQPDFDINRIPLDDPKVFEMLSRAESVGIFQLESTGMRDVLRKLRPDRFEDIIAVVALYRPGPMENIPTYISRKHGEEKVHYLHPLLEPIVSETYGIMIYQEQVMQAAQALAGYSLGGADLLRRAMGKKLKSEMDKQKASFVDGAAANDIKEAKALEIFTQIEAFAGYGFNKSHAAAYALVSYQTAYLKAHFAEEFLCASMILDAGNTDKLAVFKSDLERLKIPLLPPDINASKPIFDVENDPETGRKAVRYALNAIKNVGGAAMEQLVAEREQGGPFKGLEDFAARVDTRAAGKRVMENLIAAGAFDRIDDNRARLFINVDRLTRFGIALTEERNSAQTSLFGGPANGTGNGTGNGNGDASSSGNGSNGAATLQMLDAEDWPLQERLKREFDAIGFYLTAHPLDAYADALEKNRVQPIGELLTSGPKGNRVRIAGVVGARNERRSANGNRFAWITISDTTGSIEFVCFSEILMANRDNLEVGTPIFVEVDRGKGASDGDLRLSAAKIEQLDTLIAKGSAGLRLFLSSPESLAPVSALIDGCSGGNDRVHIVIEIDEDREAEVVLDTRYRLSGPVRAAIKSVPGVEAVDF